MQKRIRFLLWLTSYFLVSCGATSPNRLQQLPNALPPASYPKTVWLPTMEQTIQPNQNAVYAGFPLAWPQLRKELGLVLRADTQSRAWQQVAKAGNHLSPLSARQSRLHIATGQEADGTLSLHTVLDAQISFEPHFEYLPWDIKFDEVRVPAFGMTDNSFDNVHLNIEIHRYRDDEHFIIGLLPTDRNLQVLLYRTDKTYPTLAAMYADLQNEIQHGRADMTVADRQWKYSWTPYDRVAIPRISLHVTGEYPQLTGGILHTDKQQISVNKVQQNVAFLLNETGSRIVSETDTDMDMYGVPGDLPEPKHFVCDKPFYVIVRQRGDDAAPYLALWISNTELLDME